MYGVYEDSDFKDKAAPQAAKWRVEMARKINFKILTYQHFINKRNDLNKHPVLILQMRRLSRGMPRNYTVN